MRSAALATLLLAAAATSGCATLEPRTPRPARAARAVPPPAAPAPKVVRVIVPKAVKCVPDDVGPAPSYPDSDQALRDAGGAADRYQLLAAGRLLREQRLQRLEEVVKRCRTTGR